MSVSCLGYVTLSLYRLGFTCLVPLYHSNVLTVIVQWCGWVGFITRRHYSAAEGRWLLQCVAEDPPGGRAKDASTPPAMGSRLVRTLGSCVRSLLRRCFSVVCYLYISVLTRCTSRCYYRFTHGADGQRSLALGCLTRWAQRRKRPAALGLQYRLPSSPLFSLFPCATVLTGWCRWEIRHA